MSTAVVCRSTKEKEMTLLYDSLSCAFASFSTRCIIFQFYLTALAIGHYNSHS